MPNELINIPSFLQRAAQQTGFDRERYVESNIPDEWSDIVILCFFGDFRSEAILSSLILHQYIKKYYKNKYFIVCSWQGHAGLFPYADEFWSLGDQLMLQDLHNNTDKFENTSLKYANIIKNLNKYFNLILEWDDLEQFYCNGLTKGYFDTFSDVVRFLPALPSPKIDFNKELIRRNKRGIFLYPTKVIQKWNKSGFDVSIGSEFWVKLIEGIINAGLTPVVYQNYSTHDVSSDFGDKCLYVTDNNVLSLMSIMRLTDCVVDVMSGISRLAMIARCPFLSVDERGRYVDSKEYEINDLCINGIYQYKYVFSFSSILNGGNYKEMADLILYNLKEFLVGLSDKKISSSESYTIVPYDIVKEHKRKKFGIHFIKVERLKI